MNVETLIEVQVPPPLPAMPEYVGVYAWRAPGSSYGPYWAVTDQSQLTPELAYSEIRDSEYCKVIRSSIRVFRIPEKGTE